MARKSVPKSLSGPILPPLGQKIAVAEDLAFSFAYPHILQGWKKAGAEISLFSPLKNEAPNPESDAVFLPGGYPELHAGLLSQNHTFLRGLKSSKALIYGECGGFMVLGDALIDAQGQSHAMAGLLPLTTSFATRKLHLGYRQLMPLGGPWTKPLRGHEFHYSSIDKRRKSRSAVQGHRCRGRQSGPDRSQARQCHGFLRPHHLRGVMKPRAFMLMGTGSDVGKSLVAAGLCRAFATARTESNALQAAEHVQQCRRNQ